MTWDCLERPARFYYTYGPAQITRSFQKIWKVRFPRLFVGFSEGNIVWCWHKEGYEKAGNALLKKFEKNPNLGGMRSRWMENKEKAMKTFSELETKKAGELSNREIAMFLQRMVEAEIVNVSIGMIWDIFDIELEAKIKNELPKSINPETQKKEFNAAFVALTMPPETSFATTEEKEILEIAKKVSGNEEARQLFRKHASEIKKGLQDFPEINNAVGRHLEKYFWIRASYASGKKLSLEEVLERVSEPIRKGEGIQKRIDEIKQKESAAFSEKKRILESIKPSEQLLLALKIIDELGFLHDSKKEIQMRYFCAAEPLLLESARRLGLREELVFWFTPQELVKALETKRFSVKELEKRARFAVLKCGKKDTIVSGVKAISERKRIFGAKKESLGELQEVNGMSANPGTAVGKARIIKSTKEIAEMQSGEILITGMTTPGFVPAMKKAAAIVTDEGGILCHAAIVSRELGVPCVVGTRIATKAFKNGEMLEVRANHGIVRKL